MGTIVQPILRGNELGALESLLCSRPPEIGQRNTLAKANSLNRYFAFFLFPLFSCFIHTAPRARRHEYGGDDPGAGYEYAKSRSYQYWRPGFWDLSQSLSVCWKRKQTEGRRQERLVIPGQGSEFIGERKGRHRSTQPVKAWPVADPAKARLHDSGIVGSCGVHRNGVAMSP